jgi:hypothetical protein
MLAAGHGNALPQQAIAGGVGNQVAGFIEYGRIDTRCVQDIVRIDIETLQNGDDLRGTANTQQRSGLRPWFVGSIVHWNGSTLALRMILIQIVKKCVFSVNHCVSLLRFA